MNEVKTRKGDLPFLQIEQTSRFIEITGEWFFFTREKELLGPYRSREIVEHAAKVYALKRRRAQEPGTGNGHFLGLRSSATGASSNAAVIDDENIVNFVHPKWDV